jgi:hypothetical protein
MHALVAIKSSHDGTSLEFSDYAGDYFQAALRGPGFQGCGRVYAYEPSHLASFFLDLAAHWQGWSGKKEWGSLEGELSFTATSDSTGHTSLAVRLRSGPYPYDWTLTTMLLIDAGQLEPIAKSMQEFLSAH